MLTWRGQLISHTTGPGHEGGLPARLVRLESRRLSARARVRWFVSGGSGAAGWELGGWVGSREVRILGASFLKGTLFHLGFKRKPTGQNAPILTQTYSRVRWTWAGPFVVC